MSTCKVEHDDVILFKPEKTKKKLVKIFDNMKNTKNVYACQNDEAKCFKICVIFGIRKIILFLLLKHFILNVNLSNLLEAQF